MFNRLTASVTVVGLAALALFGLMAAYTSPLRPSIPELQLTFTATGFNKVLSQWSQADLEIFRWHFAIDYPFLLCYGAFGWLSATRTRLSACLARHAALALGSALPLAAVADAVENAMHWRLVFGSGPWSASAYAVAGAVASTKWLLIVGYLVGMALAAASARR